MNTINIQYYARLREERGQAEETLETSAETPQALYHELRREHRFSLDPQHLRVAVNEEFRPWDQPLQNGDTVVFLQPAAGG